jgi:hypothetical protein
VIASETEERLRKGEELTGGVRWPVREKRGGGKRAARASWAKGRLGRRERAGRRGEVGRSGRKGGVREGCGFLFF